VNKVNVSKDVVMAMIHWYNGRYTKDRAQ